MSDGRRLQTKESEKRYWKFFRLRMTPNSIWLTPNMTEIFILNELSHEILFSANCHAYSQPPRQFTDSAVIQLSITATDN